MKKNLLKILALSAIVLSIGACGKKGGKSSSSSAETSQSSSESSETGPVELSIPEVFALNSTTYKFLHEGELVRVKNAACVGSYGTTLVAGVPYADGGSIMDLKGFEVELNAAPQWTTRVNGQYADITVEGTLADVNGRPVLQNASVVVNGEAHYDDGGNRIYPEGSSSYSCGYWSSSQFVRSYYDEYMGRSMSGALVEGIFQLASVPTTVSSTSAQEFKVVFPGENTDGADEDNEYLINVTIPAGLSEKAVKKANDFFKDKEVGDFFLMNALTRYDSKKGGMGLLYENYWCGWLDEVEDEDKPQILTSWADIQAKYNGRFQTPLPNIGCEAEGTFSYIVNDYFATPIDSIGFDDTSFILVDHDLGGLMEFVFNTGSAKSEAVFAALADKAVASGFTKDTTVTLDDEEAEAIYVLKSADNVVAELYFALQDKGVQVMYMAIKNTYSIENTFADAMAIYQDRIDATSALVDLPAAYKESVSAVRIDWSAEETIEGFLSYTFAPAFAAETFADDDAWEAFIKAYVTALEAAGFVADYSMPVSGSDGYFNPTTKEFVEIWTTGSSSITGVRIEVRKIVDDAKAATHLFDVSEDSTWTAAQAMRYIQLSFDYIMPQIFGSSAMVITYENAEKTAGYCGRGPATSAKDTLLNYIGSYVMPGCAEYLGSQDVPSEDDEGQNDTVYIFSLGSATEGKCIQAQYWARSFNAGANFYFEFICVEVDEAA